MLLEDDEISRRLEEMALDLMGVGSGVSVEARVDSRAWVRGQRRPCATCIMMNLGGIL
jgi:hypothetical protein